MPRMLFVALWLSSLAARADDPLTRGQQARALAKKRGVIPVPEQDCFVPQQLTGQSCAEGLRLCVHTAASASCDGYASERRVLFVEYADEAPQLGQPASSVSELPGLPLFFEAGADPELESDNACQWTLGVALTSVGVSGDATDEEKARAAAEQQRLRERAQREDERRREACRAEARARVEKERRWHRCELLSVDACRREAFLSCKGNSGVRGLVRATWSRPRDGFALDTVKLQRLGP